MKSLPQVRYLILLLIIISIAGHLTADTVDGLHADTYYRCPESISHRNVSPSLEVFRDTMQNSIAAPLLALFVFTFVFTLVHLRSDALTLLVPLLPPRSTC